jgi:hypothetical protein
VTLDTAVKFFRRQQRLLFRAECRVERPGGEGTFDEETGDITPDSPTIVYEGPCNVREATWGGWGAEATTGEREVRFGQSDLRFPHDTAIEMDDVVVVTVSTHDASLVGQRYRVTAVFLDAWQVTRRATGEKVEA